MKHLELVARGSLLVARISYLVKCEAHIVKRKETQETKEIPSF